MQRTDIQMILCDVDGTLLPKGEHAVSEEVFNAIRYANKSGVEIVIASGRSHPDLECLFSPVANLVYFVAGDGGLMKQNGSVLASSFISPDVLRSILTIAKSDFDCVSYTKAGVFAINEMTDVRNDIYKIAFRNPDDFLKYKLRSFAQRSGKLTEVYQDKTWLEFVAAGTDKGVACRMIQELTGVPPERTAAFGDNFNDFAMLRRARMTFASATAITEVKRMCKQISYHIPSEIIKLSQERGSL